MKKYFNSNESLELCDVQISENGKVMVDTKSYNREAMERLGNPEKLIRGRLKVEGSILRFEPYAESSRRPTYSAKAVVGSTTIAVTGGNVKVSLMLSRNYSKDMLVRLIEAEMEEVLRRLKEDLYDSLVSGQQTTDNGQQTTDPLSPADSSPSMGSAETTVKG